MRIALLAMTALALAGCSKTDTTTTTTETNTEIAVENVTTADANMTNAAAPAAALASINETSWEFKNKDGKDIQQSVDAAGKYIAVSGKEHIDHGAAVMKDGKACFTSAMTKDGEVCWSDPMVAVGGSGETTSNKGEKVTVKRVAYKPLTM